MNYIYLHIHICEIIIITFQFSTFIISCINKKIIASLIQIFIFHINAFFALVDIVGFSTMAQEVIKLNDNRYDNLRISA